MFALTYLNSMNEAYKLNAGEANAIIIARHFGVPLALKDEVWAKYHLGEMVKVNDPVTKKPSARNLFFNAKEGDMMMTDGSAEKLIARGVVIGVCNVAITVLSEELGKAIGVKKEDAYAEWKAGVIPGAFIVPSGVLAVGRAQEHGCTYCFGG